MDITTLENSAVAAITGCLPAGLGASVTIDDLQAYLGQSSSVTPVHSIYDGEKFYGGLGNVASYTVDYWALRERSRQLFVENLYAKGLIKRLITNEISTGLSPEAIPDENIIGLTKDSLNEWTEEREARFALWARTATLCDYLQQDTFAEIQRKARRMALVDGDVLVVLRQSSIGLPAVQLISSDRVQTPLFSGGDGKPEKGNTIVHGVELDKDGRQVAYWVRQEDGSFKRLAANGSKTGRKLAWLLYGSDMLLDEVRGQPLLSIILQSIKELDRYRDSAQRKAVINSLLAMFIKKSANTISSLPFQAGATRKDAQTVTDGDGTTRNFNITKHVPGIVIEDLQEGEEPVGFHSQGTDIDFPKFEEAVLAAIAWSNEIPPEILILSFTNNYSASQAAINEFKIYINKMWAQFGDNFCSPIYKDHMQAEVLKGKCFAPGLLQALQDPDKYDVVASWFAVEWYGSIKPSTDMLKQAKGSELLVKNGWSNNAREARVTTGTKFTQNVKRLKRENEALAEALKPILQIRERIKAAGSEGALAALSDKVDDLVNEMIRGE